jgi:hypothetical protein
MAYWYIAHRNELLIDLDDYSRPAKTGGPWGEIFFRRRLRQAILGRKLDVKQVFLAQSNSKGHYHAIVVLRRNMGIFLRLVWQLHLGSDLYRGRADLARAARGIAAPSLLIRSKPISGFRQADAVCTCTAKHDTEKQSELGARACRVWRRYRGMSPWELFGPAESGKEKPVSLPIGKVPLDLIMEVRRD